MFNKFRKKLAGIDQHQARAYFQEVGKAVWMDRCYEQFAQEAYLKNVVAHRSITTISHAASSVPFKLFDNTPNGRQFVNHHEILSLLSKPNPTQSGKEFLESIYTYRQISGNAYILAVMSPSKKRPIELYALRPDRISIVPGDNLLPKAYRYQVGQEVTEYPVDQITGKSQILHIKNFHPLSDWYGMSSIEAAAYSIDQHNQAGEWNQALLQNGARPSGAIVVKGASGNPSYLTDKQYRDLKNMIDDAFAGPKNAGRPLLLEGGLEWQEMSLSPKDMDFIESKHSSARDVALALGMPPQLLGIPGDNTYSNLQEARLALWEQTIIPLMENVIEHMSNWLCSFYQQKLELKYDIDSISALSSRREEVWRRVESCSFLSINEKRQAVGLPPVEGGDSVV